jgi:hypothetical protein
VGAVGDGRVTTVALAAVAAGGRGVSPALSWSHEATLLPCVGRTSDARAHGRIETILENLHQQTHTRVHAHGFVIAPLLCYAWLFYTPVDG